MSDIKFIIINKVVDNPDNTCSAMPELIPINDIRSIRSWRKTKAQKEHIKGGMIAIYMKSSPSSKDERVKNASSEDMYEKNMAKDSIIKVAESLESITERLNAVKASKVEIKRLEDDGKDS